MILPLSDLCRYKPQKSDSTPFKKDLFVYLNVICYLKLNTPSYTATVEAISMTLRISNISLQKYR